jgi:uncharacterized protein YuzE
MANIRVTRDKHGMAYVYLDEPGVDQVRRSVPLYSCDEADEVPALHCLVLDFDGDGRLVGIEVLGQAHRVLPDALYNQADRDG